jgi:adenylate kinase
MRVTMIGPPGSGKSTQAEALAAALGVPHIVTSDLLHEAAEADARGDELQAMAGGNLVDDDEVIQVVTARLARADTRGGFVLDGFPRTAAQEDALDEWLAGPGRQLDAAILLDVPRAVLLERIARREDVDARDDDGPQTRRHRLDVYEHELGPLIDHYARAGKLRRVDGDGTVDQVHARVMTALAASSRQR